MWHQTESRPFQSSKNSTAKKKKKGIKHKILSGEVTQTFLSVAQWEAGLYSSYKQVPLALLSGLCEHEQNVDDIFLTILLVLWHLFSGDPF